MTKKDKKTRKGKSGLRKVKYDTQTHTMPRYPAVRPLSSVSSAF